MILIALFWMFNLLIEEGTTQLTSGTIHRSMVSLKEFHDKQDKLFNGVKLYLKKEEERIRELRKLISTKWIQYEQSKTYTVAQNVHHPTATYRLIRDWVEICDLVFDNTSLADFTNWTKTTSISIPDAADLKGVQHSLIRLQLVYRLPIHEVASGNIVGYKSTSVLEGRDLYDIGVTAYGIEEYGPAAEWLRAAVKHPIQEYDLASVMAAAAEPYLAMGEWYKAIDILQDVVNLDPDNKEYKVKLKHATSRQKYDIPEVVPDEVTMEYRNMCRTQKSVEKFNLWCEYRAAILPYVLYKMEILCLDPWIVHYYDFITDQETELVKSIVKEVLIDATVAEVKSEREDYEDRIGGVAWIMDEEMTDYDYIGRNLSQRVASLTGLKAVNDQREWSEELSPAEALQVVNYGAGGQYQPHYDFEIDDAKRDTAKVTGDRIATFLIYLSNVTEGGGTLFPNLGIYVAPLKYSAIFWYNFKRSAIVDHRTIHGSCPILIGEKWIATKWIYTNRQWYHHRCGPYINSTELESKAAGL